MRYLLFVLTVCAAGVLGQGKAVSAQDLWTVTLSKKQAKGHQKYLRAQNPKALAISPDGAWGYWYGADTRQENEKRALGNCRQYLKRGKRDCILYSSNGKTVAPKQVKIEKVSKVYKPIDGKMAPQVFGVPAVSFKGDRARAEQEYKLLEQQKFARTALKSDPVLSKILTAGSFVSDSKSGWMFLFYKGGGQQHMFGKNGRLETVFNGWLATENGLVCTFGERWKSGKTIGSRCLYVDDIAKGQIRFAWASQPQRRRKANMVAGDARWGAVR